MAPLGLLRSRLDAPHSCSESDFKEEGVLVVQPIPSPRELRALVKEPVRTRWCHPTPVYHIGGDGMSSAGPAARPCKYVHRAVPDLHGFVSDMESKITAASKGRSLQQGLL